jgi:hypothetical protein
LKVFKDDDRNYLIWINENPHGFVLNTTRPPLPEFLILHRSSCPAVKGEPETENYWTVECIKVCSSKTEELADWARNEAGGVINPCRLCNPTKG